MKSKILLFLLLASFLQLSAQNWKANWITVPNGQNLPNTWMSFRKSIVIDAVPNKAIAKIAVDTKYWLWINGKLVVFEGGLKRGPNPTDTYFDEVDLAPYLTKGSNTIAILVWYMGKDGFSHISSGKAGLLFQCITPELEFFSDATWLSKMHTSFSTCDGVQPNFRLSESNIRFDARFDLGAWQQPDFNEKGWNNAYIYGKAPIYPWNNLVLRPIPQWKNSGLINYVNASVLPTEGNGEAISCELPTNIHVTPYLKIDAPEGLKIDMRTDNFNGGGAPNVHAEYITKKGIQEFECFGWMNGQKVLYNIPKGVKILALNYRETGYDTQFSGAFNCSDPFYNRLWQKALRTLYVTMRDTYMDCPDRERAQWWGDVVVEGGESFYALCPKSHLLMRKGLYELFGWQKPGGELFAPIPAGNWNQELPSQMLAAIGYYGLWTYYQYSADKKTVVDNYEGVKRYMNLWQLKNDGTLIYRQGGWPWGDWGEEVDVELIENAWYQLALIGVRNMAHLLGKEEDENIFAKQIENFKKAFNTNFWTGNEYRHSNYKGKTDDRAQALAVLSGIADEDKFPKLLQLFKTQQYASPYMEKYVMEALFVMGYEEFALERTKKRFGEMVNNPDYSTLFEGWGIGNKGFGGGTTNHAWSGGALTVLMQYMCGIAPVEAGFSKFQVKPQPGNLKSASSAVLTIKGEIKTSFTNNPDKFTLSVTNPESTMVMVGIPQNGVKNITLNGKKIWSNGNFHKNKAVINSSTSSKYISFEVASGQWNFSAQRQY